MGVIDLRSDTVTQPTPAMREAMASAPVGDDVYAEDPTLNRLQELAAERTGKEAALFLPSGSMANQAALLSLTNPGDLVLVGENAHILLYEGGAPAAFAGVQLRTIGPGGIFDGDDVRRAVPPDDVHYAPARLVCVENTHNRSGGRVFPLERVKDAAAAAREHGLSLHLDGARLWNAVVATGTPAPDWCEPFDSVAFCLSKGLGAPVGSLLCGSRDLIQRAHRARKRLGGGMRQAGILAAAGIYALEHHLERLADDHANAQRLAAGMERLGFRVDPPPETNMVMFPIEDEAGFLRATRRRDLWINPIDPGMFRAVTHLGVTSEDVDDALARLEEVAREGVR
jgi:threonine aldolase